MRWLPLPIVMGMFGGSILDYVVRMVMATIEDIAVAGTALAGYMLGRLIGSPRVPPVGLAVIAGGIAVAMVGVPDVTPVEWTLPTLVVPEMSFTASAVIAVSLPMVVMAMGPWEHPGTRLPDGSGIQGAGEHAVYGRRHQLGHQFALRRPSCDCGEDRSSDTCLARRRHGRGSILGGGGRRCSDAVARSRCDPLLLF